MDMEPVAEVPEELMNHPRFQGNPLNTLGRGTFGSVYKVLDKDDNEGIRAVKLMPRAAIHRHQVREVINHYKLLGHPNIIGFGDVFFTQTYLCILMEYADSGTLIQHIQTVLHSSTSTPHTREADVRKLFQQLIRAVDFFHSKGITDRDIKPDNILMHQSDDGKVLKVCDFGYSRDLDDAGVPTIAAGTASYTAPEVFTDPNYSMNPTDIWSCGVVLFTMLYATFPFGVPPDPRSPRHRAQISALIVKMNNRGYRPFRQSPAVSQACKDLIEEMLNPDPKQRITIAGIRNNPWFQEQLPTDFFEANAPSQPSQPAAPRQTLQQVLDVLRDAIPAGLEDAVAINDILQREQELLAAAQA